MRAVSPLRLVLVLLASTSGCAIPQDAMVVPNTCSTTVACACSCIVCTSRDASGTCLATGSMQNLGAFCFQPPVLGFGCEADLGVALAGSEPAALCANGCQGTLLANSVDSLACTATATKAPDPPFGTCVGVTQNPLETDALGDPAADTVLCDRTRSTLVLEKLDSSGRVVETETINMGCELDAKRGSFDVARFAAYSVTSATFDGHDVNDFVVSLVHPVSDPVASDGSFDIDGSTVLFYVLAHVDSQEIAFGAYPLGHFSGSYDRALGAFAASVTLYSTDLNDRATLTLNGSTQNRAPTAVISTASEVTCTADPILLDGSLSFDPDGAPLSTYLWYVDGVAVGSGQTASVPLPIGSHVVRLVVSDGAAWGITEKSIKVIGSQAPTLSVNVTPSCLWPPNGKFARLKVGDALVGTVTDACGQSSAAPLVVTGVDGIEVCSPSVPVPAGSATFGPDFVCLESRRAGQCSGRAYTVHLSATLPTGQSVTGDVEIDVAHDQRNHTCPPVDPALLVNPGSPECSASNQAAQSPASPQPHTGSGCSSVPFGTLSLAALLLVGHRRRHARCLPTDNGPCR